VRTSHVADTKQQLKLTVALTDDRQTTEHDGVRSLLRPRQLGEDEASHQRLDEDTETRLQDQHEERDQTLGLDDAIPAAPEHAARSFNRMIPELRLVVC